jgi:hypothetical protein
MGKNGDAVSITLNGAKFAIPKDTEPNVIKGGETISGTQQFGDGTAEPYTTLETPRITGLKCKISDDNRDAFENARKMSKIPIVYETLGKSYELTGCVVGAVELSTTKNVTGEFEVHATDGGGIRES